MVRIHQGAFWSQQRHQQLWEGFEAGDVVRVRSTWFDPALPINQTRAQVTGFCPSTSKYQTGAFPESRSEKLRPGGPT